MRGSLRGLAARVLWGCGGLFCLVVTSSLVAPGVLFVYSLIVGILFRSGLLGG